MPTEERLSLVSEVEDEFTEPLERLEQSLEDVDDAIRDAGRGRDLVEIDVEVSSGDALAELEALDSAMETLEDDIEIDPEIGDVDDSLGSTSVDADIGETGETAVTSGGVERDTFTVENIDEWGESIEPFLDRETLGRRGGEVTNVDELLDRDIEDVVDFENAVELAVDPHSDVDMGTLQGVTSGGPDEFTASVDVLDDEDSTLLGGGGLRKDTRRFRQELSDLRPTMQGFHAAVASTLPVMGVFAGALPAAIVGVGALATAALGATAALAGIGALGLMGLSLAETGEVRMEPITNRLGDVTDAFVEAFAPLATSFTPIIESALTSIEAMAGPLADASAGLLAFRDEFQGLTGFVTSSLPSFTRGFLAFTEATMPLLTGVTSFLADIDVFGYLATQLNRGLPSLMMIGASITEVLPMLVNLSQGFLMVAGAVMGTLGVVAGFLNQFPLLTAAIGAAAGMFLVAVSAMGLYSIATGGLIKNTLGLASSIVTSVIPALNAQIASLLGVAAASWQAYAATAALLGVLTLGIAPVVGSIAAGFGIMSNNIGGARRELARFANERNALNSDMPVGGRTPSSSASNVYRDNSQTVIYAGDQDAAARQQYNGEYERKQYRDSVFGSG